MVHVLRDISACFIKEGCISNMAMVEINSNNYVDVGMEKNRNKNWV